MKVICQLTEGAGSGTVRITALYNKSHFLRGEHVSSRSSRTKPETGSNIRNRKRFVALCWVTSELTCLLRFKRSGRCFAFVGRKLHLAFY